MTDTGPAWVARGTNFQGVSNAAVAFTSTTEADVSPSPTSGLKIMIDDILVTSDVAAKVDIKEETSGTILFSIQFAGAGSVQITPRNGIKLPTADKKVRAKWSAAPAAGYVLINGHSVAP